MFVESWREWVKLCCSKERSPLNGFWLNCLLFLPLRSSFIPEKKFSHILSSSFLSTFNQHTHNCVTILPGIKSGLVAIDSPAPPGFCAYNFCNFFGGRTFLLSLSLFLSWSLTQRNTTLGNRMREGPQVRQCLSFHLSHPSYFFFLQQYDDELSSIIEMMNCQVYVMSSRINLKFNVIIALTNFEMRREMFQDGVRENFWKREDEDEYQQYRHETRKKKKNEQCRVVVQLMCLELWVWEFFPWFSQRGTMEKRDNLPQKGRNGGKPGTKQVSCNATRGESERERKSAQKTKAHSIWRSYFWRFSPRDSLPSHYQNLLVPTTWLLWEYSHISLRDKWRFEPTCLHKLRVIPILKIVQVTENQRRRDEKKIMIKSHGFGFTAKRLQSELGFNYLSLDKIFSQKNWVRKETWEESETND